MSKNSRKNEMHVELADSFGTVEFCRIELDDKKVNCTRALLNRIGIPDEQLDEALQKVCGALRWYHQMNATPDEFPTEIEKVTLLQEFIDRTDELSRSWCRLPSEMQLSFWQKDSDLDFGNLINLIKTRAEEVKYQREHPIPQLDEFAKTTGYTNDTEVVEIAAYLAAQDESNHEHRKHGPQKRTQSLRELLQSLRDLWRIYNHDTKGVAKHGAAKDYDKDSRYKGPLFNFVNALLKIEGITDLSKDKVGELLWKLSRE